MDHRSDIFSLGCVLYEMVSGRRTFVRDTAVETMNAILKDEPADLSTSAVELPPELAGTVRRCLEKRPQSRYQSASDLAYTLRTISSASASSLARPAYRAGGWRRVAPWVAVGMAIVLAVVLAAVLRGPLFERGPPALPEVSPSRVAVVPLENRTGDPSLDALGVMAADLIVRRFTETAAAEVVPLAEALEELPSAGLDGPQAPGWSHVLQLARQRGAGLVLAGATYLDGQALRLQARLVDTTTGDLIHAFEPVSAARGEAAAGIDTLRERVVAAVVAHGDPTIDITIMTPPSTYEAYQAFQKGQALYTDWEAAAAHYRRALQKDPHFHRARLWLGWALLGIGDDEGVDDQLSVLEGQLDRMTPFEEISVRYLRSVLEWDRLNSLRLLRRQREFGPKMQVGAGDVAFRLLELNRPLEAAEFLEGFQRREGSPFSWWPLVHMTAARHMLGDFQAELESAAIGLEQYPGVAQFFFAKARALAAMGEIDAVNEVIDNFLRLQTEGGSAGALMSATAMELGAHGHGKEADEMAARSVKWFGTHPSALSEEGGAFAIEVWALGNPEERRSFATALCMVGRWRDAENVIARLIDSEPRQYQLRGWLGIIAASRGDAATARQISDSLSVEGSPRVSGWGTYWRASIAAHLGEKERAVELLAEAFSKGFPYGVFLHSTLEFEPLWDYPPFQELIAPKG